MAGASVSVVRLGHCHALYNQPPQALHVLKVTVEGDIALHYIALALAVLFYDQFFLPFLVLFCCL